jgi:hypothetical protein
MSMLIIYWKSQGEERYDYITKDVPPGEDVVAIIKGLENPQWYVVGFASYVTDLHSMSARTAFCHTYGCSRSQWVEGMLGHKDCVRVFRPSTVLVMKPAGPRKLSGLKPEACIPDSCKADADDRMNAIYAMVGDRRAK